MIALNPNYTIDILLQSKTPAKYNTMLTFAHSPKKLLCFNRKSLYFIGIFNFTTNPIAQIGLNKNSPI